MRIHVLGSGSGGNAIVLESDRQRILVDAGFGVRTLAQRLRAVDVAPDSVTALVVTHEHIDHIRGAAASARRWRWPVYATAGTLRSYVGRGNEARRVDPRQELLLDDFAIRFVRAPHDAREHVAIVATVRSTGERAGLAYDVGHVTERFASQFADVNVLLLESNHDDHMLRTGPYPWPVKQRVAGPSGHLSNAESGLMARACVHRGLRYLLLCHLSETNNRPDIALRAMKTALRGSGFRGTLRAAAQDQPLTIGRAVQMELAF